MFGENVRKYRIYQGWSQQNLASRAGYKARSTIDKIERGSTKPKASLVIKLADALNTLPDNLIDPDDSLSDRDRAFLHALSQEKKTESHLSFASDLNPLITPDSDHIIEVRGEPITPQMDTTPPQSVESDALSRLNAYYKYIYDLEFRDINIVDKIPLLSPENKIILEKVLDSLLISQRFDNNKDDHYNYDSKKI